MEEKKELLAKYKRQDKQVIITVKPNHFFLSGKIINIFDDCFEFATSQKTSIIDYDMVSSIREDPRSEG